MTRLDELDKTEMWDAARRLMPDLTEPEFDLMWAEFQLAKARKALS